MQSLKAKQLHLTGKPLSAREERRDWVFKSLSLEPLNTFFPSAERDRKKGNFIKKSPDIARNYIETMPDIETDEYVIMKPLNELKENETPEIVIFLVNADQLSGLATLANYDQETQDNVKLSFGSGCAQSVLYGLDAARNNPTACYIGLTDPSARKCIPSDLLSFTIPFHRFLEMEECVESSFFHTDTWKVIARRI